MAAHVWPGETTIHFMKMPFWVTATATKSTATKMVKMYNHPTHGYATAAAYLFYPPSLKSWYFIIEENIIARRSVDCKNFYNFAIGYGGLYGLKYPQDKAKVACPDIEIAKIIAEGYCNLTLLFFIFEEESYVSYQLWLSAHLGFVFTVKLGATVTASVKLRYETA